MPLSLILFFISLLGIITMIGRKLVLLKNGQSPKGERILSEIPYIREIRHVTVKNIKKYGHISLVATLRFYIRLNNFLKNKYGEIKIKIKNKLKKSKGLEDGPSEKKEVSGFLKMISDYKRKIREIKHRIHEEENL